MVGYMDREALRRTLTEGRVVFWSRSRQEYWRKGDTSGHLQLRPRRRARLRRRRAARHRRAGRTRLPHRRARLLRHASHRFQDRRAAHRRAAHRRAEHRGPRMSGMPGTTSRAEFEELLPTRTPRPARSRASSSPTARRRSASSGSSRCARAGACGPAPSSSSPPSRAASGPATRSWASRPSARSRSRSGRPVWQDWGLPASRAFGSGGITGDYLEALDDLHSHWASPRVPGPARRSRAASSATSGGTRCGCSSTCPTRRPPTTRCPSSA